MATFLTNILSSPVSFPLASTQGPLALNVSDQTGKVWQTCDVRPTDYDAFIGLDEHEKRGIRQDAQLIAMGTGEPAESIAVRLAESPFSNPDSIREVPEHEWSPIVEYGGVIEGWGVSDHIASIGDLLQPDYERGTPGERQKNLLYIGRSIIFSDEFKLQAQAFSDADVRTYYKIANELSFLHCLPDVIPNLRVLLEKATISLELKERLCEFMVDMSRGCSLPDKKVVNELLYIILTMVYSRYYNEHDLKELMAVRKCCARTFQRISRDFDEKQQTIQYVSKAFENNYKIEMEIIFLSQKISISEKERILQRFKVTDLHFHWDQPPQLSSEQIVFLRCLSMMARHDSHYTGKDISSYFEKYSSCRKNGMTPVQAVGRLLLEIQEYNRYCHAAKNLLSHRAEQKERLEAILKFDQIDYIFKTEILKRLVYDADGVMRLTERASDVLDYFHFCFQTIRFDCNAIDFIFPLVDSVLEKGEYFDVLKSELTFLSLFCDPHGFLYTATMSQYYRFLSRPLRIRTKVPGYLQELIPDQFTRQQMQSLYLLEKAFGRVQAGSRIGKILYNLQLNNHKRPSLEKDYLLRRILDTIYHYIFNVQNFRSIDDVKQDAFLRHYFDKKLYEEAKGALDINDSFIEVRENASSKIHLEYRGFCYEFLAKVWAIEHLPYYNPFPNRRYWTEVAEKPYGYYVVDPDGTYMPAMPAHTLSAFEAKALIDVSDDGVFLEDYLLHECNVRPKRLQTDIVVHRRGIIMSQFLRLAQMMCDPAHSETHYHIHITSTKQMRSLDTVKAVFKECLYLEQERVSRHANAFSNRTTARFKPTNAQIADIMRRLEISYEYVDPKELWGDTTKHDSSVAVDLDGDEE
ncbi:MAG: hypothetical protein ABII18_10415 [bacterium]